MSIGFKKAVPTLRVFGKSMGRMGEFFQSGHSQTDSHPTSVLLRLCLRRNRDSVQEDRYRTPSTPRILPNWPVPMNLWFAREQCVDNGDHWTATQTQRGTSARESSRGKCGLRSRSIDDDCRLSFSCCPSTY